MARKAEFRIWESKMRRGRFYRETVFGRRTGAKPPDQHFTSLAAAVNAVTEEWIAYAKALGTYGKHSKITFLATHPVPYAKDSLQPLKTRVTVNVQPGLIKALRKSGKQIREKAVQKIVDDARNVGSGKIPKTAPGVAYKTMHEIGVGKITSKSEAKRMAAVTLSRHIPKRPVTVRAGQELEVSVKGGKIKSMRAVRAKETA